MSICWINGEMCAPEQARVSVFDHGLLYGDGVFEGLRFYGGRIFRAQEHLQRLFDSAAGISLAIPYGVEHLHQVLLEVTEACEFADGYIRLVVTRGEGPLGLDPHLCCKPTVFVIADKIKLVDDAALRDGLSVITASVRRVPNDSLDSRIKSLNYLNHIMARLEAKAAGAHEAILLNHAGRVAEASSENVFIVKNRTVLTPPVSDGALQGITRQTLMELADGKWPVLEQGLTAFDLYTADECFLCGTGAELLPVRMIDGRTLAHCPGPVYLQLQQAYLAHVYHETVHTGGSK
ncbi:MAG: branched-chain-amino-acid transaminase [Gammaproteobacteria bacterium]|nr:branched-chain-amino-acid transaminase [Gammaproteobacteria bacterium]MDH5801703.1 branched-chain-amino-acid transaminase [Gammaproteobacteria bacterium]